MAVASSACIGMLAGLCGSLVDSVLGATLQYSALEASGKRVLNSRTDAEAAHGSRHISGRDVLSNAQVGCSCSCSRGALAIACDANPQVNLAAASVTSVVFALAAANGVA